MFLLRFDMRAPASGAPPEELYQAALDICEWVDGKGPFAALLCEHHMASDGYLPSPLILASAIAARTRTLPISIAVFQLPLYNPVRLAEEMCVLDLVSRGRVSYVGGLGYREEEYDMLGVDFRKRGALAEENVGVLLQAVKGQPFEHDGRRIHVTPGPFTPGGPSIAWGGGSLPAVRRAGRHGLDFFGQKGDPELGEAYINACREHGHEPGSCILPSRESPTAVFVDDDVDAAWDELGQYFMNDVKGYAEWNEGNHDITSLSFVDTPQALREENRSHRVMSVNEAVEWVRARGALTLHPLIGGLPPERAWPYLHNLIDKVLPRL